MKDTISSYFSSLQSKKIFFMGIGVSHINTIKLFAKKGLNITACDKRERQELGTLADELELLGVKLRLGAGYFDDVNADILFRTPGMNIHLPQLVAYRENGGVVTSEMEEFFSLCPCPIIAVTGSDGKTTTTTLISEMLKASGKTVHLGGNIGKPLLCDIENIAKDDICVVELSSFQLITMSASPAMAVLTNITPNHLDMHKDMQEYIDAKKNIFRFQSQDNVTVLNLDDAVSSAFLPELAGKHRWFSLLKPVENGAFLGEDGILYKAKNGIHKPVVAAKDVRLPGIHNVANYLAAIACVGDMVAVKSIAALAKSFAGVEHRLEFVREIGHVKWYNDSIATSPTRAIAGLRCFANKIILIAGGYDKNIPFAPLAPEIIAHVHTLILIGDTAEKIDQAVTAHPDYKEDCPIIFYANDLEDAVTLAHQVSWAGDVISLSPACASFDCYKNFEQRGAHFKELVLNLKQKIG